MDPNQNWHNLKNLIIVACHAVYLGHGSSDTERDECWALEPFQKGEPRYFIEHIKAGIDAAAIDEESLLIFSGGQTRAAAGRFSEAKGYWEVAEQLGLWQSHVRDRATTEEFARDSFENVLFGICRFHECTARWPIKVGVVSWKFKSLRFDMHRDAIRFPAESFRFIGVNNPENLEVAEASEFRAGIEPFARDPYGTNAVEDLSGENRIDLAEKRRSRNPFSRSPPYETSCPELKDLLRHKGPHLFDGVLLWTVAQPGEIAEWR